MSDLAIRWTELQKNLEKATRRRTHDRVRIQVTMVSVPMSGDDAGFFYVQVKSTQRLRRIMMQFQSEYFEHQDCFENAATNFATEHGPQLSISESALDAVLFQQHDWRDPDKLYPQDIIENALDDFIFNLTGFTAQVTWANG